MGTNTGGEPRRGTRNAGTQTGEDWEYSLVKLNNLQYETPGSASVVISKQFKFFSADKTTYAPRDTIMATLSTGQQYVDLNESYFSFDIDFKNLYGGVSGLQTDGGISHPALQHIMQLFRHIRITHFSGTVVWEDQHFGQHWLQDRAFEVPYEKFVQELEQARGQTSCPKLRPYHSKLRKPGVVNRDHEANYEYKVDNQANIELTNASDVGRVGFNGALQGDAQIASGEGRNLPYYVIHPVSALSIVSQGQLLTGVAADYDAADINGRQRILSWANWPKGKFVAPATQDDTNFDFASTKVTYHIPFHWIPFFKHEQNSLMPSMLANGLRIEFMLGDTWDLLAQAAIFPRDARIASTATFEISRWRSNLQLVDLTPRIYALLLQDSINTGLNWVVDCTYTTMMQSVASSFQMECTRALSRVKMVKAIPYLQKSLNTTPTIGAAASNAVVYGDPTTHFSYASCNVGFSRWRFTLGSMSYPAQDCEELLDTGGRFPNRYNNKSETYAQILNAYGYNDQRGDDGCFINYRDFCESGVYQACVSLERSPNMQQTGLSLSTDASLRFIATLGNSNSGFADTVSTAEPLAVYLFVTYTSTVLIIGDKVIVKN